MSVKRPFLIISVLACMLLSSACVRQNGSSSVEVVRSGELSRLARDADIVEVVYVDVRDNTNHAGGLRSTVEAAVRRSGFAITDNPSQAGYIVQITTLAAGVAAPDNLHALVNAGYGSPSSLSGGGGTVLLADILLVQRRVPVSKRQNLKSISSRSAVASSQMRLGLLTRKEFKLGNELPQNFKDELTRQVGATLNVVDAMP